MRNLLESTVVIFFHTVAVHKLVEGQIGESIDAHLPAKILLIVVFFYCAKIVAEDFKATFVIAS